MKFSEINSKSSKIVTCDESNCRYEESWRDDFKYHFLVGLEPFVISQE